MRRIHGRQFFERVGHSVSIIAKERLSAPGTRDALKGLIVRLENSALDCGGVGAGQPAPARSRSPPTALRDGVNIAQAEQLQRVSRRR